MILSDYLSRHRQKDLDPSELIPISFCCLKTYRSFIDDKIGEVIFCVKTRASAKASGETVGEVHGADKPLDPNYKPEHQSKSKLPSVTGKSVVTVDRSVDVSVNPYKEALTQEVDVHLHEEPSLEMKKCHLTWSIFSTEIDYTTNKDNSSYVEMNTSNLYNKLQEDEQLISGDSSDQWDERFEEVTCSLHYSHKFDDTNDVSTTYLGSYIAKDEPETFPVDNHIPFDGRRMSKAYLSNGTPMKLFFDSGASRSYLSKRFYDPNPVLHDIPKFVTTCTGIRIGNGSIVPALFVIPTLFMTCGHTFEIFTIVAEKDDDMDLVFGF